MSRPSAAATPASLCWLAWASSRLIPYLSARCVALSTARSAGAWGSSSKLRQVTLTSSRCSNAASAASKRRLPT